MYAPLALKIVYSQCAFSMSDSLFVRAPVLQITANPPMTTETSRKSKSKSHAGAIAGGAIGGIAALLGIGAIALVAGRRQSRSRRRQSVGSAFEREVTTPEWPMTVTPFNPTLIAVPALETDPQANSHRRWTEGIEPEGAPLVHTSPSSDSPVSWPYVVPFPVGLSCKELARLRNGSLRSQFGDSLPIAATELVSLEAQRLQSEVESLRREMQQLRAERPEAPPSYRDDGGA